MGPPDAGKSNTAEAVGLVSYLGYGGDGKAFLRCRSLFYIFSEFGWHRRVEATLRVDGSETFLVSVWRGGLGFSSFPLGSALPRRAFRNYSQMVI